MKEKRNSRDLRDDEDDYEELAMPLPMNDSVRRPAALDYGVSCNREDVTDEMLQKNIESRLNLMNISKTKRESIEERTREQWKCNLWHEERRNRITASKFGKVYVRRALPGELVEELVYPSVIVTRAMRWGTDNEKTAIEVFEKATHKTVQPSGSFIHPEIGFLAASPDGLIPEENASIEVKCPYSARYTTVQEAINKNQNFYCRLIDGKMKLKRSHTYYYQVQGQLAICNAHKCYFIVWTPKEMLYDEIFFDELLWRDMMKKLEKFYINEILPEIIDSRANRNMPIRRSKAEARLKAESQNDPEEKEAPKTQQPQTSRKAASKIQTEETRGRTNKLTKQRKPLKLPDNTVYEGSITDVWEPTHYASESYKKIGAEKKLFSSVTNPKTVAVEEEIYAMDNLNALHSSNIATASTINELISRDGSVKNLESGNCKKVRPREDPSKTIHLINGHLLPPVLVQGVKWQMINTCGFDSIVTITAAAIKEDVAFCEAMEAVRETNQFAHFCCMLAEGKNEEEIYIERAKLLMNTEIGEVNNGNTYNCLENISKICTNLNLTPSLTLIGPCCNFDCAGIQSIQVPYLQLSLQKLKNIYVVKSLVSEFEYLQSRKCNECKTEEVICEPIIGQNIFILVDGLQDGSMIAHLIEDNKQSTVDTSFMINRLDEEILIQEKRFILRGIVRYYADRSHYAAYVRKANGNWEVHDDLRRELQLNPLLDENINPQLFLYTCKN